MNKLNTKLSDETRTKPLQQPFVGNSIFIDNMVKESMRSVMAYSKLSDESKLKQKEELLLLIDEELSNNNSISQIEALSTLKNIVSQVGLTNQLV